MLVVSHKASAGASPALGGAGAAPRDAAGARSLVQLARGGGQAPPEGDSAPGRRRAENRAEAPFGGPRHFPLSAQGA